MSNDKEQGKAFDYKLFKRVIQYTKPYRVVFFGVALAAILLSAFAVLTPILVREVVDTAITNKDAERLLNIVMVLVAVLVGEVTCQLLFTYYANWLGESVIRDLRIRLFEKMIGFKMTYYDNSSIGVLVTRAVSDMQKIGEIFSQGFFVIVADILKMVVVAVVMLVMDWELSLIVFLLMPVILLLTRWFQRSMKVAFTEVRTQVALLNGFVQERLAGMKIVQLFTRERIEQLQFEEINRKHKEGWLKTIWYNSIFFALAEMISSVALALVIGFAGYTIIGRSFPIPESNFGVIFAFVLLTGMLFRPLRHIADKFNTLQMGMVAARRVFDILDTDSHIVNTGTQEKAEVKGEISFEQVHFGYVPDEEVLHGISFEVKAGETLAIVGATGAGKSTIINLLNRFYDIQSGHIRVDGTDVREFELSALRKHIAIVLQDVFLFADTIQNNIALGNEEVSLEEIQEAAEQIGVHDFIASFPGGYQYNVKERGSMLSGGQRQLIAFLRAYVSKPSILILDEATSSVDTYTEQLIQKATEKITEGRSSIIIAHRLATVKKADRILVMEAGRIVETGTHKELLEQGGYYRDLYEAQFLNEEVIG